jgi:glycine oxidase
MPSSPTRSAVTPSAPPLDLLGPPLDPVDSLRGTDVAVLGGGLIGLAAAWSLAEQDHQVVLVDPAPLSGASWVAAGMLAPVSELHAAEAPLVGLGLAALEHWPVFAQALTEASGLDLGLRTEGTVLVAATPDDHRALLELLDLHRRLGLASQPLTRREARQLEPGLAPGLAGALLIPGDHHVDPRLVARALALAARRAGVRWVAAAGSALRCRRGAVEGLVLDSGVHLDAPAVVLAAGWRSAALDGLPATLRLPLRPVKGQILRLATRTGTVEGPRHCIRALVEGAPVYLVPRRSGEVVLGATSEEQGADPTATAGALYELLRDAVAVVPGVRELELTEVGVGHRPATPDHGPLVGPLPAGSGADGLVLAVGHHRNGVLLCPITAEAVRAAVEGDPLPDALGPFGPTRFSPDLGGATLEAWTPLPEGPAPR